MDSAEANTSKINLWIKAIRPFSLTATAIPVFLGAMITLNYYEGYTTWLLMIIIALATPLFQIGGNLISTYFDFKTKVDREDTIGPSKVLVDGLLNPKSVFRVGLIILTALLFIGMILVYLRGTTMLIIGLLGIAGAYGYSALKYRAMGDLMIYLAFGPLMVFGTFYALTGSFALLKDTAVISIPIGFLVVSILHANNTRDIIFDKKANITTFASALGFKISQKYYYFLVFGAYVSVVIFIALGILSLWTFIVFLSLPMAILNAKAISKGDPEEPQTIAKIDEKSAKLHLIFGILLCLGILIDILVK